MTNPNSMVLKGAQSITTILEEFNNTKKLCMELIKTKHYAKLTDAGIFAIVQKSSSMGINPLEALNGGMYFVNGKVEMQAILMAKLIRLRGHSITMDKSSTDTKCILHGKRSDNGDTWRVSFSIEDAKRAGIYKQDGPWGKYPDIMCYNRALSKLGRQLFADVIGNCYVEGDISDSPPLFEAVKDDEIEGVGEISHLDLDEKNEVDTFDAPFKGATEKQVELLNSLLDYNETRTANLLNLKSKQLNRVIDSFDELSQEEASDLIKMLINQNKEVVIEEYKDETEYKRMA